MKGPEALFKTRQKMESDQDTMKEDRLNERT